MSRLSLSDSDKSARDWFVETTRSLGCQVSVDAMVKTSISSQPALWFCRSHRYSHNRVTPLQLERGNMMDRQHVLAPTWIPSELRKRS